MTATARREDLQALVREAMRHRAVMNDWRAPQQARDRATAGYCRAADRIVELLDEMHRGGTLPAGDRGSA